MYLLIAACAAFSSYATAANTVQPASRGVQKLDSEFPRVVSTNEDKSLAGISLAAVPEIARATVTERKWMNEDANPTGTTNSTDAADLRPVLLQAVEASFERIPQLQQTYAEYLAAKADVDEANGQRWPQVQIGSQSRSLGFGGDSGSASGGALSVNVTTTVFDWGRTSKTIGSRSQLAEAGYQQYRASLESSAYDVSSTLAELAKQRLLLEISEQFVDRMQELVSMLQQIVVVDAGRSSELTQAKARLLQAQATRDSTRSKVRDTEITLQKFIGEQRVALPETKSWNIQPGKMEMMLAGVEEHPGIKQAEAEAESARLNAGAVKASALPAVNWVVSKTTGRDMYGRTQPFQTMLALNWNAFQGGSARAAAEAAMLRAKASEHKIDQQRQDLQFQVRAADEDARTLLQRADLYSNLSDETDRVRKAFFEQWYHLGKRSLLDVLTAENDHYTNRFNEVTSRFDGYTAVFKGYSSAGELVSWLHGQ